MSWDQQDFSFGTPNAQPPTPTKTPTSAQFPSPTFQTPRNNTSNFEDRSGWTPTFAEEYSVFNATPGRLTSNHPTFADTATPRPSTIVDSRRHSSAGNLAAEIATHVHHFSPNPELPLPPVDPANQLSSSPGPYTSRFDESRSHITPRKPRKRLEEAFSGQTATPPATASKGSRKLAPKLSVARDMQNDMQGQFGDSQTPTHQGNMMEFPVTSSDPFHYPMSAPATAPVFSNTKPFWDPDSSMGGMELGYGDSLDMMGTYSHRTMNSLDWGRSNQMFQETINAPPSSQPQTQQEQQKAASKRPRPLAPKAPQTTAPGESPRPAWSGRSPGDEQFVFTDASPGFDVFNINPDLLHNSVANDVSTFSQAGMSVVPVTSGGSAAVPFEPYAHQRRLAEREREDMEEFEQRTPHKDKLRRFERATASSPVRGSRPGLQRSMSDNRGKSRRSQDRISRSGGRSSPVKRGMGLTSIPELRAPKLREEVQFVVDNKGKASVETILVKDESGSFLDDDSSTDEEPIEIPSRDTSFNLPTARMPKIGRFDSSMESRRHSMGGSGYSHSESSRSSQLSTRQDSHDSEAETVVEDEGSGDATRELAKLMDRRKRDQIISKSPSRRRPMSAYHNSDYEASSLNTSPTTFTDPDNVTPVGTRGTTTRCVCKNSESRGFMIQCESCDYFLHGNCVNIQRGTKPRVYVCVFCVQTPNMRGGRMRKAHGSSPLAHKSFKSFR